MKVKSTLRVINEARCKGRRGVTDGQTYQRMVGWPEIIETDRVRLGRATYKPGTYEQLHWHPIEACYYVISGHATVRNIEGKEFEVGPGSMIYAPAGIAGAHDSVVPSVSWAYSSKTSSFGGSLAQSYGIALFFAKLP